MSSVEVLVFQLCFLFLEFLPVSSSQHLLAYLSELVSLFRSETIVPQLSLHC